MTVALKPYLLLPWRAGFSRGCREAPEGHPEVHGRYMTVVLTWCPVMQLGAASKRRSRRSITINSASPSVGDSRGDGYGGACVRRTVPTRKICPLWGLGTWTGAGVYLQSVAAAKKLKPQSSQRAPLTASPPPPLSMLPGRPVLLGRELLA